MDGLPRALLDGAQEQRQAFIAAWVAKTGEDPEDAVLVQTIDIGTMTVKTRIEHRTSDAKRIATWLRLLAVSPTPGELARAIEGGVYREVPT